MSDNHCASQGISKNEVPQHLQIQLNPNLNKKIIGSIISKNIRERPIRVKSVLSVFHFLICGPAEGWGHNGNTENYICDNIVSIRLRRGQKFKHGFHGEHGFGFFTDFFSW